MRKKLNKYEVVVTTTYMVKASDKIEAEKKARKIIDDENTDTYNLISRIFDYNVREAKV